MPRDREAPPRDGAVTQTSTKASAGAGAPGGEAPPSLGLKLRSLLFFALYNLYGVVHSIPSLLAAPFQNLAQRYRFVNIWSQVALWMFRHLIGVRTEVEGLEHIPTDRPVVVIANHQSPWETFYLQLLISPQATILKRELLRIPFFGWALAVLRPIAIDRGQPAQALKTILREGKARLDEGIPVVIFPEGTRQPPGTLGPFNAGGAMLACRAGADVLPMAHNAGDCWPTRTLWKRPGTIRLRIGAPIAVAGKSPKAVNAEARAWIRGNYPGELRTDVEASG